MDEPQAWAFLPVGYALTVLIELPVLWVGLRPRHGVATRLLAGLWLTACTYPVVVLVLPALADPGRQRLLYLLLAETFAPAAECALFGAAFRDASRRDLLTIAVANVLSFAAGEALIRLGLLG